MLGYFQLGHCQAGPDRDPGSFPRRLGNTDARGIRLSGPIVVVIASFWAAGFTASLAGAVEPQNAAATPAEAAVTDDAAEAQVSRSSDAVADTPGLDGAAEPVRLPPPAGARPLPEPDQVWVDTKRRQVLVDGYISLQEGYLEMFACTVGTKEHESIVALRTRAYVVHAALLAIGAKPGHPVQYQPDFAPPTGAEIEVEVRWLDPQGKWQSARAQEWIRDAQTKAPMQQPFVFAGSDMWQDPETGQRHYLADAGDFICVSNFSSAMLDVPIESSQSNDGLLFEANPQRVPALGTPVRVLLTPKPPHQKPIPKKPAPLPPTKPSPPANTQSVSEGPNR
jgi:hypothetical protein